MKSCFDEYLTDECEKCEFWKSNEKQIGCCCSFPIDECEPFKATEDSYERVAKVSEGVKEIRRQQQKISTSLKFQKDQLIKFQLECYKHISELQLLLNKFSDLNDMENKPSNFHKFESRQDHAKLEIEHLNNIIYEITELHSVIDKYK